MFSGIVMDCLGRKPVGSVDFEKRSCFASHGHRAAIELLPIGS